MRGIWTVTVCYASREKRLDPVWTKEKPRLGDFRYSYWWAAGTEPQKRNSPSDIPGLQAENMLPTIKRVTKNIVLNMPPRLQRRARSLARILRPSVRRDVLRARLKKRVPVWSLFLILLLGSASGIAAQAMLAQISGQNTPAVPDFTIASQSVSQRIPQGYLATLNIELASLHGFAGSVNLDVNLSPVPNNVTVAFNPETVSLFTGSGSSRLTLSIGNTTSTGNYKMNLIGTSNRLSHTVTVFVTITPPPPPDFGLSSTSSTLTVSAGSSGSSTILLTSLNGFTGNVNLTVTVSPDVGANTPRATLSPNRVTLSAGATQGSSLVVSTNGSTPRVSYSILIVSTNGSITHSLVVPLTVT